MIEKIEPYKTGLVIIEVEELIRKILIKLNESIEKQNEIIDYINSKEIIEEQKPMEEIEKNESN